MCRKKIFFDEIIIAPIMQIAMTARETKLERERETDFLLIIMIKKIGTVFPKKDHLTIFPIIRETQKVIKNTRSTIF